MSIQIDTVDELVMYLKGVFERAKHHGPFIDEIIYPLAALIITEKDTDKELQVRQYKGKMVNALWVWIRNIRYVFSYDHRNQCIMMREKSMKGPLITEIDNSMSVGVLRDFIGSL